MLILQNETKPNKIFLISQDDIIVNPEKPRVRFDYDELDGLAQSIRTYGILQPLLVRPFENGKYELIAGARRLRAARMAELTSVPCIVCDISEKDSAILAMLENIQREDLDYFEQAEAFALLVEKQHIEIEALCKSLGISRYAIKSKLRLLELSCEMRYQISRAGLTERHARALLSLTDEAQRIRTLSIIIDNHLNISETENYINQILLKNRGVKSEKDFIYNQIRIFVNTMNKAVNNIRKAVIDTEFVRTDNDEYVEYIVRIPKQTENDNFI